jgi:anti-sigma factor RsiW
VTPLLACRHDPEPLAALVDGIASPSERQLVEAQLLTCRDCREYLEQLRWLGEQLRTLAWDAPPPAFVPAVMRQVHRVERQRLPARLAAGLLAAAVFFSGLVLTVGPAPSLAEASLVAEPDLVAATTWIDPLLTTTQFDSVAIAGLSVAVAASAFLLTRLTNVRRV